MLIIILLSTIVSASFASNLTTTLTETIVKVEPTLNEFGNPAGDPIPLPGTQFTVNVSVYDVINLYGFYLKFRWNTTYLAYMHHEVLFNWTKHRDEVFVHEGWYWIAYSKSAPEPPFNGSGTFFTMTFEVIKQPFDFETGTPGIDPIDTLLDFISIDLLDKDEMPIPYLVEHAIVRIWERRTKEIVKVEPAWIEFGNSQGDNITIPGTQFTVAVKIYNVTNLYAFDLMFRWDTTFLEYVNCSVRVPRNTYLDGVLWNPILTLADEVNATAGTYWIAYSCIAPAPSFNGTGTVFNMTFKVIKQPYDYETGGPNVDPIDTILDFSSTHLAPESSNVPIGHKVEPATVRIWEKRSELPPYLVLKVMPTLVEKLPINSVFNINIWMLGADPKYNITSFNITLNFNSTLIAATGITEGSWPTSYAENTTEIAKEINNTTGTATYALELGSKKAGPPTIGILFTVAFHVIYESLTYPPPSSELVLDPTNISDRMLGPIPHTSENGTYTANRPPPIAEFTWSPSSSVLLRGQTITFNASESHHPLGGKIEFYQWGFGDGAKRNSTDPIISHIYLTNGTMTVILNVTDYGGFWDTKSATLNIVEPPPKPYLAVDPTYLTFGPYLPEAVGQQFDIKVYIKSLDAAWSLQNVKFSLSYNTTLVDIIGDSANVTIPDLWTGPNEVIVARPPSGLGKVTTTLQGPSVTPSGHVLVATINFTVKYRGIYPAVDICSLILSDIELTGPMGEIPTEPPVHGQVVIESLSSPVIKVEPSLIEYHENAVDKQFTVAVKIINVTNLYGFDLRLRWNTTVLEYVGHSVHIPRNTYTDGVLYDPTLSIANSVNQTTGTYWISYASMPPAWFFNGSGTVFTMTFKVKYHPKQPEPTINVTLELYVTELADNSANPIPHTREQGMVTLYQILPSPAEAPLTYIVLYAAVGVVAIAIIAIYFMKIRKPKDENNIKDQHQKPC
jgi:hypothetical protein